MQRASAGAVLAAHRLSTRAGAGSAAAVVQAVAAGPNSFGAAGLRGDVPARGFPTSPHIHLPLSLDFLNGWLAHDVLAFRVAPNCVSLKSQTPFSTDSAKSSDSRNGWLLTPAVAAGALRQECPSP